MENFPRFNSTVSAAEPVGRGTWVWTEHSAPLGDRGSGRRLCGRGPAEAQGDWPWEGPGLPAPRELTRGKVFSPLSPGDLKGVWASVVTLGPGVLAATVWQPLHTCALLPTLSASTVVSSLAQTEIAMGGGPAVGRGRESSAVSVAGWTSQTVSDGGSWKTVSCSPSGQC